MEYYRYYFIIPMRIERNTLTALIHILCWCSSLCSMLLLMEMTNDCVIFLFLVYVFVVVFVFFVFCLFVCLIVFCLFVCLFVRFFCLFVCLFVFFFGLFVFLYRYLVGYQLHHLDTNLFGVTSKKKKKSFAI